MAAGYRVHPRAIAAQLEVGMGDQAESLKLAYQDTFTRIVLRGKSIDASLAHEARLIQAALDASLAPCWPPDPPSAPQTCRIR